MSEYAPDEGSPQRHGNDSNLHNISLEDPGNNSIIGKVKSRVSSILPNRLSKWFSPSAKLQNDSLNGSICAVNTTVPTRRRRRLEVEEEENYDDDEEDLQDNNYRNVNDDDDDESQNSDDEYISLGGNLTKQTRRDLNVVSRQPPAKRSRLNTEIRDSPLLTRHQPLLSSTPAVGSGYSRNSSSSTSVSRSTYQRLNLYSNQNKKEPAFNFGQHKDAKSATKVNTDIIDLISNPSYENEDKLAESSNAYSGNRTGISSRKSLNIPSSTSTLTGVERVYASVAHLKRQPLSTAKAELSTHTQIGAPPRRTSTTIQEVQDREAVEDEQQYIDIEKGEELVADSNANTYNGRVEGSNNFGKRQKLINGTSIPESNEAILLDSASESGESAMDVIKPQSNTQQRKTGLFNMSTGAAGNTRNSSRTSSFGNGLNFYSHLEGRKSLFSGSSNNGISNTLNNSTLSLTSLNRRQFNASIYGSTSALSDSRLLNTFSPFYKGKTTYGGAAAYNKYTAGAGASAVRITPTLIRPTSSLSTLSSNTSSLTNNVNAQISENSTISSTAKRILDLINDFATPLSEAKKMASSLKTNPNLQIPPQAKGRLNESDLNASRAMRLSQVRTPYSRPDVILQPSGNASGRGISGGPLPPIKELQVPTMSQLLQMKKMQSTTEKARKIAQNSATNTSVISAEYTLPNVTTSKASTNSGQDQELQKHTNKIRNKVTNSLRPSAASKDLQDEEPPPPVNLPNIAFPLMQSVPKIDIQLNTPSTSNTSNNTTDLKTLKTTSAIGTNVLNSDSSKPNTTIAFNSAPIKPLNSTISSSTTDCKKMQTPISQSNAMISNFAASSKTTNTFKFSDPIQIADPSSAYTQNVTKNDIEKYKFSPPLDVIVSSATNTGKIQNSQTKQPQLKEGSCLAALAKPFTLPTTTTLKTITTDQKSSNNASLSSTIGFGDQFKKSTNEWECDVCMIRNKSDVKKCVACETPRKQSASTNQQALNSLSSLSATSGTSNFGQQFKKSASEWECDVCMIRNKQEATKCIACETTRKGVSQQSASALPPIKNSFGDAFKPKAGTWECQTCMISNKNEVNECVACQTKKPGVTSTSSSTSLSSAAPATQFKFGFAASAPLTNTNSNADASFKSLAAQQKASKWECDACMTRNDSNRTKCACCEQPKPGSTSAESTDSITNKFQFGATAASKFTFGFGTGANAPKEDDLRKEMATKNEETSKPSATVFVAPTQGFQFGIKPITTSGTSENKKDETDANKNFSGFKFGAAPVADSSKSSEKSTISPASTSFGFSIMPTTTIPITSSTTSLSSASTASTPSVKFTLPPTTSSANTSDNKEKSSAVAAPTFGFGTSSISSTPGGFSFGNKTETQPTTAVSEEKKGLDSFAFKAPATISTTTAQNTGFVFGSSTTNTSSTTSTTVTNTSNTMTITSSTSTTTAAVKPMFSFGSPASNTPAASNSQATPAFGGFSFGSHNSAGNATDTSNNATASKLFGAITSASTSTSTANATSTAAPISTPASTNIFGSFGSGGVSSNGSATPIFGSSAVNPPANNNSTTVSSSTNNTTTANSTPTFGSFGGSKTTSNVFGSFGGVASATNLGGANSSPLAKPTNETKPIMPVFGTVATSSTSSQSNSGGFVFGSSANTNNSNQLTTTASATNSVTSTSTTWPKNSFVFGSAAASTTSTNIASSTSTASENKDVTKASVFGTFGSTGTNSSNQQQASSIFGVPTQSSASGPSNSSSNLFGTNSVPAATSIFGANSSGNAATPAPAFGSSPFGGAASSTSATPTFGSTAASGTSTFGGFGATSNNTTTNTTEVKKPEAAFNFGATPATQSTSGGFNFGSSSSTTKPAFNFGGTSTTQQPTFNFTGTAESQNSTKPFQFGATPSAPVFNFSRGALEGTPNAPFQFNAGAAPVSSNIFAPTPTPGAQTAQQAKRKIRAPIRRLTQR